MVGGNGRTLQLVMLQITWKLYGKVMQKQFFFWLA
jgi:hypothetical protein